MDILPNWHSYIQPMRWRWGVKYTIPGVPWGIEESDKQWWDGSSRVEKHFDWILTALIISEWVIVNIWASRSWWIISKKVNLFEDCNILIYGHKRIKNKIVIHDYENTLLPRTIGLQSNEPKHKLHFFFFGNIDPTNAGSNFSTSEERNACINRRENHRHMW